MKTAAASSVPYASTTLAWPHWGVAAQAPIVNTELRRVAEWAWSAWRCREAVRRGRRRSRRSLFSGSKRRRCLRSGMRERWACPGAGGMGRGRSLRPPGEREGTSTDIFRNPIMTSHAQTRSRHLTTAKLKNPPKLKGRAAPGRSHQSLHQRHGRPAAENARRVRRAWASSNSSAKRSSSSPARRHTKRCSDSPMRCSIPTRRTR